MAFNRGWKLRRRRYVGIVRSGSGFSIHQALDESLEGRATAALKDVRVALPEGMVLNTSAANGLASCTEEEMGLRRKKGR